MMCYVASWLEPINHKSWVSQIWIRKISE